MFDINLNNKHHRVRFFHGPTVTECEISCPEDDWFSEGFADCSIHDNFCKAIGRKLALARAISFMSREDRKLVWNKYWSMTPKRKLNAKVSNHPRRS